MEAEVLNMVLGLALDLAKKGQGLVEPNPCVGAVLFNEQTGEIAGQGHHGFFGGPHAEVEALKDVEDGTGLTLVVTLEPCSHYGKTPPCCELVVRKKISKLIYFSKDPNPKVAGKGLEFLRSHGVQIEKAPEAFDRANRILNAPFFNSFEKQSAYIHLKWAQSLDGKTSLKGQSKWITSEESRLRGHLFRAQSSAIAVGSRTLELDNPSLDVRLKGFEGRLPALVVLDPKAQLYSKRSQFKCVKNRKLEQVFWVVQKGFKTESFQIEVSHNHLGELDLNELAQVLFQDYGQQSLYVEGGAHTLGAFLNQGAYHQLSVFTAPILLGSQAVGPTSTLSLGGFAQKKTFSHVEQEVLGSDHLFRLYY